MQSPIFSRVGVFTSSSSSITLLPVLVSSWPFSLVSFSFYSSSFPMFSSSLKYSPHRCNTLPSSLIISPSLFLQPLLLG
jgi:hypothetical protein